MQTERYCDSGWPLPTVWVKNPEQGQQSVAGLGVLLEKINLFDKPDVANMEDFFDEMSEDEMKK